MKTRTILKKLAVLIIFIFITNIQAQPAPCGCPLEREALNDVDKSFLTYGNLIKGDLDNPASSDSQGAASCNNCAPLAFMVLDYLNKEETGDKNPFFNKKLYEGFPEFALKYTLDKIRNHISTIYRDYLKPKYPDRTMTIKDFHIPNIVDLQGGDPLTQSGLIKFAGYRHELTTILDNTKAGDSGIISIKIVRYQTSSLKVVTTGSHALPFFTFLEDGKKITRIFDLQETSGIYMDLDANSYLHHRYIDATMPNTQQIFIPKAILVLKKA